MCIRDSLHADAMATDIDAAQEREIAASIPRRHAANHSQICLLYTSDAADERSSVDLGGRRIIKKKNTYSVRPGVTHTKHKHNTTNYNILTN